MRAITIPTLPSADLDESIAFYEALGFQCTYRQQRLNPYAVVELATARVVPVRPLRGIQPTVP